MIRHNVHVNDLVTKTCKNYNVKQTQLHVHVHAQYFKPYN